MNDREKHIPASHELILSDRFTAWVQSQGLEGRLASKSRVVLSSAAPIWHRRPADLIVLQQTPRKRHPGQLSRFVFWMIETENGLTGSWILVVTWSRLLILSFYLLFIPILRVCHGWKQLMCDELLRSQWVWLIIRAAAGASVVSATEEAKGLSITLNGTLPASLHHHFLPLP